MQRSAGELVHQLISATIKGMKYLIAPVVAWAAAVLVLRAQTIAVPIGPSPTLSLPAIDDRGLTAVVASSVSLDGQLHSASDLYVLRTDGTSVHKLTNLPNNGATWIDLAADGSKAAYNITASPSPGTEEIHVVDTSSGSDVK